MTRLLWLTPEVPEPGGSGGAIRSLHLLRGMARAGFETTVVAPSYPEQRERAAAAPTDGVELELVERPASRPVEAMRGHLRHPALAVRAATLPHLGWQAEIFWTEIAAVTNRVLELDRPVAALVEHDFCVRWGLRLPCGLPLALATHNALWVQQARDGASAAGAAGAWMRLEAARSRRMVAGAIARYSWFSAVSDGDASALTKIGARQPVLVAPNGADVEAHAAIEPGGGNEGMLLFTGTLSYPPNDDAARWLIETILPRVREQHPGARLTIAGRGASAELTRLAGGVDGVELLGWVASLEPLLESCAVALAPLRSGGGTRLKIVEAFAAGRAVVATTTGAEGIDVQDGVHLRLADDADGLAAAIVTLLGDPEQRRRLGQAGRLLARERYDWRTIADGFAASLGEWIEATR